jgi:type IV pilus assembly protein PilQ
MRANKYLTFVVALGASLFACAAFAQQNSIDAFNAAAQGGRVIVRITTKQPLAAPPASFTVTQPARIALDFPNTANGLGRANQEINEGDLRGMSVVQVGDRTRMVLNLRNGLRDAGRRQQHEHRATPVGPGGDAAGERFAGRADRSTRSATSTSSRRSGEGEW